MTAITKTRHVKCRDVWELEYGYVERTRERYQDLVEVTRLCGVPVYSKTLDTEHVPTHYLIEKGCFGETVFRSKFAEYIR